MDLCAYLLSRFNALRAQLEIDDQNLAAQWTTCLAKDTNPPLAGAPAASNSVIDVQLRIDALIPLMYSTDPVIRNAAIDAINAYNAYLSLVQTRLDHQTELNQVVTLMVQNNCPLP